MVQFVPEAPQNTLQGIGGQGYPLAAPVLTWVSFGADLLLAVTCFGLLRLLRSFWQRARTKDPLAWLAAASLLLLGIDHAASAWQLWPAGGALQGFIKLSAAIAAGTTVFFLWKRPPARGGHASDLSAGRGKRKADFVGVAGENLSPTYLRTEEARFRALIEVSPQIVWLADAEGNNTFCNQTWYDFTGLSVEETRGASWLSTIYPDDRERIIEAWAKARAEHTHFEIEVRFRRGCDGAYRWHVTKAREVISPGSPGPQWMGVALDIHELKVAEMERRISEERLELVQEAAAMIGWEIDLQTFDVHSSGAVEDVLGTVPPNIPEFLKIIHPDDLPWYQEYLEACGRGEFQYDTEFRIIKPSDNSVQWLKGRGRTYFDEAKCKYRMLGISYNITQQKEADAEKVRLLRELEGKTKLLATILAQMPSAIFVGEAPSGKVVFANDARIEEIFRYPYAVDGSMRGFLRQVDFVTDGRRYEENDWPLTRAISRGEVIKNEDIEFTRGDGARGVIRLNAVPIRSEQNEIIAGVVICQDLTDLKQTQLELLKAKDEAESANRLKSSFLANMSHEIRTPVSVIMGFADLLADAESEEERRHCVRVMKENGRLISVLINDILDLSRVEAGRVEVKRTSVDVRALIEDTIASLQASFNEKKLQLRFVIDEDVPERIGTDPHRFKQVLWNLLVNALKFTDQGRVDVFVKYPQQTLTIDVRDTGIGIAQEHRSSLFMPFTQLDSSTTRRHMGAGLGLALSQKLVHLLGGRLSLLTSELGQGSTFRFELIKPLMTADDQGRKEVQSWHGDEFSLRGRRVLVADDVAAMREIVQRYLRKSGAKVDLAIDGLDAVKKALQRKYDVVIMDVQMPALDGYAATQRLRDGGFHKPIIALTAHAMAETRLRCLKAGYTDWLTKPVNADELLHMVSRHLKESVAS